MLIWHNMANPSKCSVMKKLAKILSTVFLLSGVGLFAHAQQCDLDLKARSSEVAAYVDSVLPCLTDLPEGYWWDYQVETQFFDKINEERTSRGLPALKRRYELSNAVRFHSLDMAVNNFFEHSGPDGRSVDGRIAAFDRRAIIESMAENIAKQDLVIEPQDADYVSTYDFSDALDILHESLMNSEGHRKNILSKSATHVQIGVIRSNRGIWVTQNFISLSGTLSEDLPMRFAPGEELTAHPTYTDTAWTFRKFKAERASGQLVPFEYDDEKTIITRGLEGDASLAIASTRKGELPNMTYSINFIGPAFTVEG